MANFVEFLQGEHIKLLQNYADLQKRYDILAAATGNNGTCIGDTSKLSFVQKLVAKITEIYDNDLYSDITIHCDGHQFRGHRLVIATRTDYWNDLLGIDRIELEDVAYNIGSAILKWMYTDYVDGLLGNRCLMQIFTAAFKYRFLDLQIRCELLLLGRIDCDSCLMLYEFAIKNDLIQLKDSCKKIIKTEWNQFTAEDFTKMSASLLYDLIKSNSKHILHSIIRLKRSDILLLFFIERFQELPKLCNEEISSTFPLELALESDQIEIATSLVNHRADVNVIDSNGRTLLMRMLMKNEIDALIFLTQNGANFDHKVGITGENLLHIAASTKCSYDLIEWLSSNLNHLNINDVDSELKTPLMRAVDSENVKIIELLLQEPAVDVNKMDQKGYSPITSALFKIKNMALAELIVKAGADLNVLYKDVFMIHHAVYTSNLDAVQFLCRHGVDVNKRTTEGMLPLQIAVDFENINMDIIRILMRSGASILLQISNSYETLLHHIIGKENGDEILKVCIESGSCNENTFSVVDANGHTPITKAVLIGKFQSAELLINAGANINEKDREGLSLLLRVINKKLDDAAVFLLDHGADISGCISEKDCFSLAVEFSLLKTVRRLCTFIRKNEKNINTLLWEALQQGSFEVAKALIESGCDLNDWFYSESLNCRQTLLHKAIGLELRDAAVFLINVGCDIDVTEQRQINEEQSSRDTPLLACIRSDFDDVALCLIERGARLDRKDAEERSAIHLAVSKKNMTILNELLSNCNPGLLLDTDCYGNTPLDMAIETRNYLAAEILIKKAPNLITQVDKNGEMLLHKTVRAVDLESVLFLISASFDVNARAQNESSVTALHLSAQHGSEIIMRNLILAGADVSATSADGFTPLHVAAYNNHEALCMILLENGAPPNVPDRFGNTPLHKAVLGGSVACVNVLIGDSRINLRAVNKKQQNALFLTAGDLSRTNSLDILQMFLNADPQFPLDARDADGFTVFLLSYLKGNENMCHALLRYGVCLGIVSQAGISVFKHVMPTKQLLFSLLDKLEREPCWADGHSCSECEVKFSLTMRKHHCRHCGRLVCARCSEQEVPILKYGMEKPARIWYAVLLFMPISILFIAVSITAYIYFFTSCTLVDFYSKSSDILEKDLLGSRNDGKPRLMSRFLTEKELQKVFALPEYTPRDLDLTQKEREFLNKANKLQSLRRSHVCSHEGQRTFIGISTYILSLLPPSFKSFLNSAICKQSKGGHIVRAFKFPQLHTIS
ncbi:Ankyrin repeats (3 copies) family protein [Acanthocheilonema viteae]